MPELPLTPPKALLADRWQLIEYLGAGSMGEVWRGRHAVLGHDVAIKLMKSEAAGDQALIARFVREARIAARLRHKNIARVEDFGASPEGRPFLVMELLRGRSLEVLLHERARLDRDTVVLAAHHVGAACDVAHALGIVHRDLKPDNCFLVQDDDGAPLVKVLDFGVAKVTDGLLMTHHGGAGTAGYALLGTPMYMSPEQARGQGDVDGRSDLWSLGLMLYELLTGQLPYNAPTLPQLLCAVLSEPIPPPSSFDRSLPPTVDAWAARALERDRAHRFQSGRELAAALANALEGRVPTASQRPPAPAVTDPAAPALPPTVPLFEAVTLNSLPAIRGPELPPTELALQSLQGAFPGAGAISLPPTNTSLAAIDPSHFAGTPIPGLPAVLPPPPAPAPFAPRADLYPNVAHPPVPAARGRWRTPVLVVAGVVVGIALTATVVGMQHRDPARPPVPPSVVAPPSVVPPSVVPPSAPPVAAPSPSVVPPNVVPPNEVPVAAPSHGPPALRPARPPSRPPPRGQGNAFSPDQP